MFKWLSFVIVILAVQKMSAQSINKIITRKEAKRIEKILADDKMQGRGLNTPGIDKASEFIAAEFKKSGLQPGNDTFYFQEFGPGNHLKNIIGILPGKSKPKEIIIFSAHYDHLGIGKPNAEGDSVYNGANDNASGLTAVILLAKYFANLNNNGRTLIFVAFTAEESGGFGSKHFSEQHDPENIMAMFNIEMIGTQSKWGRNSAYLTGYEKTDMGEILKKNLKRTKFKCYADPYPQQQLFYRSDNAALARQGVPAHTISTSKMDSERFYHTVDDEVTTLDLRNMARIIKAIAISARTIVSGADSPTRIAAAKLNSR